MRSHSRFSVVLPALLVAHVLAACMTDPAGPLERGAEQAVAGPGGVTVTPRTAADQLAVSWTADPAASQYFVFRSQGGASTLVATIFGPAPSTSYVDTGLSGGTSYCYAIQSQYADGSTSDIGASACATASGAAPSCQLAITRLSGLAVRLAIATTCNDSDGWSLDYRMDSSAGGLAVATVRDHPCGSTTNVEMLVTGQLPLTDLAVTAWLFRSTGRVDCTVIAQ